MLFKQLRGLVVVLVSLGMAGFIVDHQPKVITHTEIKKEVVGPGAAALWKAQHPAPKPPPVPSTPQAMISALTIGINAAKCDVNYVVYDDDDDVDSSDAGVAAANADISLAQQHLSSASSANQSANYAQTVAAQYAIGMTAVNAAEQVEVIKSNDPGSDC